LCIFLYGISIKLFCCMLFTIHTFIPWHVTCMVKREYIRNCAWKSSQEESNGEYGIDGTFIFFGIVFCEHGDEHAGSTNVGSLFIRWIPITAWRKMLDYAFSFICKEMCNHIVTRNSCPYNLYAILTIVVTLTNV